MGKLLFNSKGVWGNGFAVVRMIIGILLIYHGTQAFESGDMDGYGKWLGEIGLPFPLFFAYAGKSVELLGGICLGFGLFTRVACSLLVILFSGITFLMGHGKILTDDQHPFLFILLALIFLFEGPGPWSLDKRFFNQTT